MSRRVGFAYEDAALLIRAAEKWYAGLVDACRNSPEDDAAYLPGLERVRALKKRAGIGQTQLEQTIATSATETISELRGVRRVARRARGAT